MPKSYYSNSIYSSDTIPISEETNYHHHYYYQPHQAHSLISQAPDAITFSTASPTILPMTDHHDHNIDIRDLDARLARVEQLQHQHHQQNHQQDVSSSSEPTSHGDTQRRPRPPLDTSLLPRFTKSSTVSTTSTATSSASATTHLHPESVGLAPGAFSKPRVPRRSRRSTFTSGTTSSGTRRARSEDGNQQAEFRYYGRHGNQWLFNDFSVTGAVARGVRRVFGKDAGSSRDWYDERK